MIIIRSEANDSSTSDVMEWLYFLCPNIDIRRINSVQELKDITIHISSKRSEAAFTADTEGICSGRLTGYWYRRGKFLLESRLSAASKSDIISKRSRAQYINNKFILEALDYFLEEKPAARINRYSEMNTNKIVNLNLALFAGLDIPETIISNKKEEILNFAQRHKLILIKDIDCDEFAAEWSGKFSVICSSYGMVIGQKELSKMLEKYNIKDYPLIYQQYVEKQYELRIFYLKGRFFPMAIFSQQNEKTKVDFRNYDTERPNRCVPYILPEAVAQKLDAFMRSIDMNCGSIDMICTPGEEYVFLEVNPVGQYQWLEKNCNYPVSKAIAEELLKGMGGR